jgi:hypothetical protein
MNTYRCMFETRLRRPAKVIATTIVIDIPAASKDAAKTRLLELWPRQPGVLPAKHNLRITPTEKVVYKKFQDYAKRPRR